MENHHGWNLAGTRVLKGVSILFKYYIVEGMTMYGMLICIRIVLVFMPLIVPVFKGTIGGNGIMKDFRMVMMRHQVVSQER